MRKTLLALAISTVLATPVAVSENQAISVDIVYDKTLLATEVGTKEVAKSIRKQAKAACSQRVSIYGSVIVDRDCVADISAKAMAAIKVANDTTREDKFADLSAEASS